MTSSRALRSSAGTQPEGSILAIDYGKRRFGLALSDERGIAPRPLGVWQRTNRRKDIARLRDLAKDHHVRQIVVGLPLHLDGTPSETSVEAERFAGRIRKALGIPVEMIDERLSSWEAEQTIKETRPKKARRGTFLDDVAAAVILRNYIEHTRAARTREP